MMVMYLNKKYLFHFMEKKRNWMEIIKYIRIELWMKTFLWNWDQVKKLDKILVINFFPHHSDKYLSFLKLIRQSFIFLIFSIFIVGWLMHHKNSCFIFTLYFKIFTFCHTYLPEPGYLLKCIWIINLTDLGHIVDLNSLFPYNKEVNVKYF